MPSSGTNTIRNTCDRLLRTMLTPPDFQQIQVALSTPILDATDGTVSLGDFMISEDEALLRQGSLVEAGLELMRVHDYDPQTRVIQVARGEYSTPMSGHDTPLLLNLNPSYPLYSIFEAVRDNIVTLYPRLSSVREVEAHGLTDLYGYPDKFKFDIDDDLAVGVVETFSWMTRQPTDVDARIVEIEGKKVLILDQPEERIMVKYRRKMGRALDMDDTLASLGVNDEWVAVIIVGAAADLMAGRDIPAAQTEWIGQALEAENIRVGTRGSISVGLARYRELLIDRLSREEKAQESNKVKVHIADPFAQVPGL